MRALKIASLLRIKVVRGVIWLCALIWSGSLLAGPVSYRCEVITASELTDDGDLSVPSKYGSVFVGMQFEVSRETGKIFGGPGKYTNDNFLLSPNVVVEIHSQGGSQQSFRMTTKWNRNYHANHLVVQENEKTKKKPFILFQELFALVYTGTCE